MDSWKTNAAYQNCKSIHQIQDFLNIGKTTEVLLWTWKCAIHPVLDCDLNQLNVFTLFPYDSIELIFWGAHSCTQTETYKKIKEERWRMEKNADWKKLNASSHFFHRKPKKACWHITLHTSMHLLSQYSEFHLQS